MPRLKKFSAAGGWPAIWYTYKKARSGGGLLHMWKALRSKNACKTCALGMGGQQGGMVNERGRFPEVCKKSIQAMAADLQGAIHENFFTDFSINQLRQFSSRDLEAAGRLTKPLYAGPLDLHYREIDWDVAIEKIATNMAATSPDETFFYFSGRSSNEAGFLLQLFARLYGTNNINNCSYYCHQASGVGLTSVTGSGTATVVLNDLEKLGKGDLLFLIGGNPASNHPRLMTSIIHFKRRGGKVIVINPLKELGLTRFRVPSDVRSMLFGSTIADEYLQPHIGGDIALLAGIACELFENHPDSIDHEFVDHATEGFDGFRQSVCAMSWDEIVEHSGIDRETIAAIATQYAQSGRAIFCWAMGITHHAHGVENVQMIANLAMLRGMLGRQGAGLLPLRGHSNVQGIGSVGATPALKQAVLDRLQSHFDVSLPTTPGLDTMACMERAAQGDMTFAWHLGGNLFASNPDLHYAAEALSKIDMTVFLSTTLNSGHLHGKGRESIILPVLARDEESQSTTQESMFNFVRLSDGGKQRHDNLRSEVQVIAGVAESLFAKLKQSSPLDWQSMQQHNRIREAIARVIPGYEKLDNIDATKEEFQIAGRTFHTPTFNTESGRARFHAVDLPEHSKATYHDDGHFQLMTIRSEGQFNTVVYEEEDIYRQQDRRDVVLLAPQDIERLSLQEDDLVTVRSETGMLHDIRVREFDIRPGNAAMYYPEANAIVPRTVDDRSRTPAFKNVSVTITKRSSS